MAWTSWGLSIGMALGCIFMVLFHQVPVSAASAAGQAVGANSGVVAMPTSTEALPTSPQAHAGMEMPGLELVLVEGNSKERIGSQKYVSVHDRHIYAIALTETGAVSYIRNAGLASKHVQVEAVQLKARMVPVLGTVDKSTLRRTEEWLSASGSALRSLTAWLSDGGRQADAAAALHTALALYPGDINLVKTGVEPQLHALYQSLAAAESAFAHRDRAAAMRDAIRGFDDFMSFRGLSM
ncbi:hypothetical protein GCM10025858_04070 [Alicyclobacillus sacchari]|nr:hypothetical protein GCM10025858_04070 [Alicyclobacillus sacchari]